jgi:hypothetical protein
VDRKIRERSKDVLIRQLVVQNNTSEGKTEQGTAVLQSADGSQGCVLMIC